ncbi:MAG TPA: glycosyltransferase family 39 protein [Candidatus Saccharimonadales bacterium]
MVRKIIEWVNHSRNDSKVFWVMLLVSAVASGLISLWIGLNQSVWFDEAYSIYVAKQPLDQLIALVAADTHPPFYYILLHFWGNTFGWSELSLRLVSVLSLTGTIAVAGLLLRRLFGSRIAIGALPFMMIAPMLLRYGFEIRMYAFAALIGIAATYVLVRIVDDKTKQKMAWLVVYGILVALGMYSLYYLALLWMAHAAWLIYHMVTRKESISVVYPWVASVIGAVAIFAPWLPTFLKQTTNGALAPIGQPLNLENLLGIVSFNSLYQPVWQLSVLASLGVMAVLVVAVVALKYAFGQKKIRENLMLLVFYIGIPIAVLMIVSLARSMYVERYLAHVTIGLVMLVGVALSVYLINSQTLRAKASVAVVYGVILIGTVGLAVVGNYNFQRLQKPEVKQVAAQQIHCDTDTTILANDPYVAIELSYYLDCAFRFYSTDEKLGGGYAPLSESPQQLRDLNDLASSKVIYVYYGDQPLVIPESYKLDQLQENTNLHVASYSKR